MAARARAAVSESSRKTGSGATDSAISSSIRSLPAPARASDTEPQSGQGFGQRLGVAAVMAAQAAGSRWTTSETSQCGQPQARRTTRQAQVRRPAAAVDHHDRLAAAAPQARRAPRGCAGAAGPRDRRARACRGSRPPAGRGRRRARAARGARAPASSRAAASPSRRRAPRRRPRRGGGRPRGRRSGGRPPACRRRRAPRRRRSARGRRPGRRPPSAGRRRPAPRPTRSRCHSSRRSPAPRRECSTATRSPKRASNASQRLRRQRDLGDEHDRAEPALQRRLRRRRGRPRSCPTR